MDASETDLLFAFGLNCRSMFRTMQAFLPNMPARSSWGIINIASVAFGPKGVPNRFIYGGSNAAVIGMMRSAAVDYVTSDIRCNCLCSGTVEKPSVDPRIAANATASGSIDAARATFVTWQPMGPLGKPRGPHWWSTCLATTLSSLTVRPLL